MDKRKMDEERKRKEAGPKRLQRDLCRACFDTTTERREQLAQTLRPLARTDDERSSIEEWVKLGGAADELHWFRVTACGWRMPQG